MRISDWSSDVCSSDIDHVVCSHYDDDHINGLIELVADREIGTLWVPFIFPADQAPEKRPRLYEADLGPRRKIILASVEQAANLLDVVRRNTREIADIRNNL